jgi:uncharacterized protein
MNQLRVAVRVLDALEARPRVRRWLGRALTATPWSRRLPNGVRAFLGQRAFDLHDVDLARGEIGLFGVREVLFSAHWIGLLHDELDAAVGAADKDRLLYAVGERGAESETRDALATMGWIPAGFARVLRDGTLLEAARADADVARFLEHVVRRIAHLTITEGGWGNVVTYDVSETPIRVVIAESIEAKVCGQRERPTCALTAGGIAGQLGAVLGRSVRAREMRCRAVTSGPCEFEVELVEQGEK